MSARFEIVRTDAEQPWHARFVAPNGRIVWTTETYARRAAAIRAVEVVTAMSVYWVQGAAFITHGRRTIEVRLVDERAES